MIANALESFDFRFPDARLHTFAAITEYVVDHLRGGATANIMTSEAYLTLEAENKKLKASTQASSKKRKDGKGKGKGKPNKNKKNRTNGEKTSEKPKLYCHAHGIQHTHSSGECKLMASDTARFTAAMRSATGLNQPPGGSTKILGRE